jgi:hypothetical protein
MSISKEWCNNKRNQESVLQLYRGKACLTKQAIADRLGTVYHNVLHVIAAHMPEQEHAWQKAKRYAKSKRGWKNPMYGKKGPKHHNWIGLVDDGYGYLTCLNRGKRQFVHRIVMARALGIRELPDWCTVHHIDEDKKNNDLDNLVLTTNSGHKVIHVQQKPESVAARSHRLRLEGLIVSMTSQ